MAKPQTAQDRDAEAMAINEMSGVRVTAQVQLAGVAFALEATVFSDDELAINGMADRFAKIMGRQKAKIDLAEKLLAMQANREMLANLAGERDKMLRDLATKKMATLAGLEATWKLSGKRNPEFQLTAPQRQQIEDQFGEGRIAAIRQQYEDRKLTLEQDAPIIERQIVRLRAIVDGAEPDEDVEPLREAAE